MRNKQHRIIERITYLRHTEILYLFKLHLIIDGMLCICFYSLHLFFLFDIMMYVGVISLCPKRPEAICLVYVLYLRTKGDCPYFGNYATEIILC